MRHDRADDDRPQNQREESASEYRHGMFLWLFVCEDVGLVGYRQPVDLVESARILPVSRDVFDEVDSAVMQCAYASQDHFGRLCEGEVYENDIKAYSLATSFVEQPKRE